MTIAWTYQLPIILLFAVSCCHGQTVLSFTAGTSISSFSLTDPVLNRSSLTRPTQLSSRPNFGIEVAMSVEKPVGNAFFIGGNLKGGILRSYVDVQYHNSDPAFGHLPIFNPYSAIETPYVAYGVHLRKEYALSQRTVGSLFGGVNALYAHSIGEVINEHQPTTRSTLDRTLIMTDHIQDIPNRFKFVPSFGCELGKILRSGDHLFVRVELHVRNTPLMEGEYWVSGNDNRLVNGTWKRTATYPTLSIGWRGLTGMFRADYKGLMR